MTRVLAIYGLLCASATVLLAGWIALTELDRVLRGWYARRRDRRRGGYVAPVVSLRRRKGA